MLACTVVVDELEGFEGIDVEAGVPFCADDPRDVAVVGKAVVGDGADGFNGLDEPDVGT